MKEGNKDVNKDCVALLSVKKKRAASDQRDNHDRALQAQRRSS